MCCTKTVFLLYNMTAVYKTNRNNSKNLHSYNTQNKCCTCRYTSPIIQITVKLVLTTIIVFISS